ncbi:MAG: hypothetical protein WD512_19110 [Candidatus Paceibacterota bacterium]
MRKGNKNHNLATLQEKLENTEITMKKLEKHIEKFSGCTEIECENYSDCQCMETLLNLQIFYSNRIKIIKNNRINK